ncbi:c-type cytochrome [Paucibacter sp. Y2R2-4]|uniref:c-type cytochrome n=1 Tax=Paucibacter sp. Y2R2-4 TaxID=2893553 RepID=UPI0021E468A5|nr:c-type cytochrome [Paucibacter sp. Y2R2-4]MCV2350255.1 cytochrome C [Paucibacter sp. Y2R2-4]
MMARRLSLAAGLKLGLLMLSLASSTAQAAPATDWRAFDACMACHASDKTLVGPSFAAIRERYAAQPDAPAQLAQRIKDGSSGRWGSVPMPANSQLTPELASAAARWILGLKAPAAASASAATSSPQAQ